MSKRSIEGEKMDPNTTQAYDQSPNVYQPLDRIEMAKVIILGVVTGLLIPLAGLLIVNFFINPVFCAGGVTDGVCVSRDVVANHVSAVLLGLLALALLANWGVYRPLLIILGVTIAMWGLVKYLSSLSQANLAEFVAFSAMLHGLSFLAFYWILRLNNFPVSLGLTVVGVAAACWALAV